MKKIILGSLILLTSTLSTFASTNTFVCPDTMSEFKENIAKIHNEYDQMDSELWNDIIHSRTIRDRESHANLVKLRKELWNNYKEDQDQISKCLIKNLSYDSN